MVVSHLELSRWATIVPSAFFANVTNPHDNSSFCPFQIISISWTGVFSEKAKQPKKSGTDNSWFTYVIPVKLVLYTGESDCK